jgi:hypothetical protein
MRKKFNLKTCRRSGIRSAAIGCLACILAGCFGHSAPKAKSAQPVQGKVLYQGKPVAGALVVFHPWDEASRKDPRPAARTNPEGGFQLSTNAVHDGAPPGKYQVTVVWKQGDEGANKLPEKYAQPATSDITVDVKAGATDPVTIELHD